MAPTVAAPSVVIPPPTFTNEPFFGTTSDLSSPCLGGSAPGSPCLEQSIRRVMTRYGAGDLHGAALLPSYRCLRRRRPQEENQAVAVTHDDNTYKIMVDVRDFVEGSLTVRALGDNELVIEGVVQKKEESSPSANCQSYKSCSRNFQQRFMFPGLQVEGVTSTVSSDGVLTVTAPRTVSQDKSVEFKMPVGQSSALKDSSSTSQTTSSQTTSSVEKQTVQQTTGATNNSCAITQNITARTGEHIVPIEVEGQLLLNTSGGVSQNYTGQSLAANQQSTLSNSTESSIKQKQVLEQEQQQSNVATQGFRQADSTQLTSQDKVATQTNSIMSVPITPRGFGQTTSSLISNICRDSLIPIDSRGLFFQDSFFENSRRQFQEAVNKVMKRTSSDASITDPINWYTSHRATNLLEDTRAGTVTTEEKDYKIVLDVRDFEAGSVSVRAVGESELLVEGKVEKKTEGTSISRSFRRRFVLPGMVKGEAITSALSADGVLTITAPKKDSTFQILELKGDDANMSRKSLANSSIFGSQTPSCASPSISIPASSVTSPTPANMAGPFEPVYSRGTDEIDISLQSSAQDLSSQINSGRSTSTIETSRAESSTTSESQLQSRVNECLNESSKILNTQREHLIPINQEPVNSFNSNEKIVNINYIDKNQKEIDSQTRLSSTQTERTPQFQLVGTVKDLTDSNLKETVKQRKSVGSLSQNRDIAIRYDNPSTFVFPIVRRGPFYQDSFFNGVHQNFQSAIRQVLDRWVDVPSLLFDDRNTQSLCNFDRFHNTFSNYRSILDHDIFDDFTCYKTLRHRSMKEENQVSTVRDNVEDYKIVLDVHGFSEKDLTIRATSHNELIVEGKVEQNGAGSRSSHTFKKQFILPGPVRMDAVYSALSADDVLTITVPKNKALPITDRA